MPDSSVKNNKDNVLDGDGGRRRHNSYTNVDVYALTPAILLPINRTIYTYPVGNSTSRSRASINKNTCYVIIIQCSFIYYT